MEGQQMFNTQQQNDNINLYAPNVAQAVAPKMGSMYKLTYKPSLLTSCQSSLLKEMYPYHHPNKGLGTPAHHLIRLETQLSNKEMS